MASGVTEVLPGRVRLGWMHDFIVFAPKKHFSVGYEDGAAIHGFWKENFDGAFYIHDLQEVVDGKCPQSGKWHFFIPHSIEPPLNSEEAYSEINAAWIERKLHQPFTAKAHEGLNYSTKTTGTLSMHIEQVCFYQRLKDIPAFANLARIHGSTGLWTHDLLKDLVRHVVLDATYRIKPEAKRLQTFLKPLMDIPHSLVFVHFLDEHDVLCGAQSEFLNVLSFYMKDQYPSLDITIVDVVVRNVQGARPYLKEFWQYFQPNQLGPGGSCYHGDGMPFVMVMGKTSQAERAYPTAALMDLPPYDLTEVVGMLEEFAG